MHRKLAVHFVDIFYCIHPDFLSASYTACEIVSFKLKAGTIHFYIADIITIFSDSDINGLTTYKPHRMYSL
ncbi:hypothetical protein CLV42_12280 [Chitinophaga ginsengisoli]|uniref:Uncharacterized protein n=1 Tax=Chitinophaga ginsengisoli TaxID=363837 RepID=A0A2P8FL41_9BACT|nr:hypothetical protein CLV42_12280 [Chitinophaga ginsengisoli]